MRLYGKRNWTTDKRLSRTPAPSAKWETHPSSRWCVCTSPHPQLLQLKWSGWYGSFLKIRGTSSTMAWHFWQMYFPRPWAFSRLWHGRHKCLSGRITYLLNTFNTLFSLNDAAVRLTGLRSSQSPRRRERPDRHHSRSSRGASWGSWPLSHGQWWTRLGTNNHTITSYTHHNFLARMQTNRASIDSSTVGRLKGDSHGWQWQRVTLGGSGLLTALVTAGSEQHLEVVLAVFSAFKLQEQDTRVTAQKTPVVSTVRYMFMSPS